VHMAYYRFEIESPFTPTEVISKIQAVTKSPEGFFGSLKKGFFPFDKPLVPFVGRVDIESFQIHRDIRYRNSFLPIISGRIESTPTGSHVRVTMRMHLLVSLFMVIWFSGVASAIWASAFGSKLQSTAGLVAPIGMFAFGIFLVSLCFFPEAIKAKKIIEAALKK